MRDYRASMRRFVAALALLPLLAACGSSTTDTKNKPVAQPQFDNVGQLVNQADLNACVPSDTGHAYVTEVTCGDRAVVAFFDTDGQRDQWLKNYLVNGLPEGAGVVYDGRWAIACPLRSTCSAIKANIGGTLTP